MQLGLNKTPRGKKMHPRFSFLTFLGNGGTKVRKYEHI